MNSTQQQQTSNMATPIKKTKTKKTEQTEVTFVKVVRYTTTLTKKDLMEDDAYAWQNGTLLTKEEKEVLWKRLCARSSGGCVEVGNDYEEEDENGDWTEDDMNDVLQEEIDEMMTDEQKEAMKKAEAEQVAKWREELKAEQEELKAEQEELKARLAKYEAV